MCRRGKSGRGCIDDFILRGGVVEGWNELVGFKREASLIFIFLEFDVFVKIKKC